jgi:hypothetical protein
MSNAYERLIREAELAAQLILETCENVVDVILFGSVAEKKCREDSDIDFLIPYTGLNLKLDYYSLGSNFNCDISTFPLSNLVSHIKIGFKHYKDPFYDYKAIKNGILFRDKGFSIRTKDTNFYKKTMDKIMNFYRKYNK